MKHLLLSSALLLSVAVCPAMAQEAPSKQQDNADKKTTKQDKVDALIKKLGADEYEVREDATSALIKMGRPATKKLQAALKSATDPEVKNRLQFILKQLNALPEKKSEPKPQVKEGTIPRGRALPTPELNEIFKEFAMPKEFQKLFGDLQKQLERELQESMKDMMNPNGQPNKPRVRVWTFPPRKNGQSQPTPLTPLTPKPKQTRSAHPTGLRARLLSPVLRTHLRLQQGEIGIVVTDVKPGSWAAKCGLKLHDVLLNVGDKPVTSLDDLSDLSEKSIEVTIIRRGERLTKALPKLDKPAVKKVPKDF